MLMYNFYLCFLCIYNCVLYIFRFKKIYLHFILFTHYTHYNNDIKQKIIKNTTEKTLIRAKCGSNYRRTIRKIKKEDI